MTDISFTCPHCKQHLAAPPEMAKDRLDCPTCLKPIQVPTAAPVRLTASRGPLGGRLVAGLVGGFLLAVLAANMSSVLFGDVTAKEQGAVVTAVSGVIFFGLWTASIVFAVKANRAAKAWRRLLISNACLSFALPLAGFITMGKAAYHLETEGREFEALAMAGAGGIAAVLLAVLGFFLGAIFLTVGLLVGRDGKSGNGNRTDHVAYVGEQDTPLGAEIAPPACPQCGSTMSRRIRPTDGTPFWGCPKCPVCMAMAKS